MRSLACSVILLTGVATVPVFAQSALTPEQLTLRVERLTELSQRSEAKLSAVQAQLKTLSEDMARLSRLIDNSAMLEMIQQVDDLSEDINLLRGDIEVQGNEINEIKKRQRELYLDSDRRLRDLESGTTAAAPAGQIIVPPVDSTTTVEPEATSSTGQQASSVESSTTESAAPATQVGSAAAASQATPSATQREEKEAYEAAFDLLKEGRYKNAKIELKDFITKYPQSSYAGNAQYWLGEAHYVTRNFDQAIIEFENVLNNYANSNKVPDAMLKLGYTFYELKQYPQAKTILNYLREQYPNATASRLAGKRLDRIRKEGH